MSILSGVLSGGGLILSALGAALDPSHHPFKRALERPGGPAGRRDAEVHEWACHKIPDKKGASRQKCENIHNPDRKPKIVVINKAAKKRYNKAYRNKHVYRRSRNDPRFKHDVRAAGAAYQLPKKKARRSKSKR